MSKVTKNSSGKVWYGMHFYPGVAEYSEPDREPYRIFINEDTIRKMDPTFAAKPIFVEHVEGVESDLNELRKEADGWVVESFFNSADGKHWVKFITVSDKAEQAIKRGFRLSNAYVPSGPFGSGGLWNGVQYEKEVLGGEYEHLAIVRNPRYEESVILTPEQFKTYNENLAAELKRIANSKGDSKMAFKLFKKAKVENTTDIEGMYVTLPKSGKEVSITKLVNDMDQMEMDQMANGDHHVMVGDEKMKLNDLVKKHMDCMNEMAEMKKNKMETESEVDMEKKPLDVEGDMHNEDEDDDMKAKEKAKDLVKHEEKEMKEKKENEEKEEKDEKKKMNAADKAKRDENFKALKNAESRVHEEVVHIDLAEDQVARGKSRYGSN